MCYKLKYVNLSNQFLNNWQSLMKILTTDMDLLIKLIDMNLNHKLIIRTVNKCYFR